MNARYLVCSLFGGIALMMFAGCSATPSDAGPPGITRNSKAGTAPRPSVLPADHQLLLEKYVAAYLSGSGAALDKVVDFGGLFDEVVRSSNPGDLPSKSLLRGFRDGWVSFQSEDTPFNPTRLKNNFRPGGVQKLSHQQKGEQSHVLLRIITPDAQLPDYRTLIIGKDSQNRVRILDIRLEHSGTTVTGLLREKMQDGKKVAQAKNAGQPLPPNYRMKIRKALETSGAEAALDVIQKISLEAKRDRSLAELCLVIVSRSGNQAALQKESEQFLKLHPQAQQLIDFVSLKSHLETNRWDAALPIVDRIGLKFQGDPFLHVVRARLQLNLGKPAEAEKQARLALIQEPKLPEAYDILVSMAVQKSNFKEAVVWLQEARNEIPDIRPDFAGKVQYRELLSSPEYQKWQSEPPQKAQPGKSSTDLSGAKVNLRKANDQPGTDPVIRRFAVHPRNISDPQKSQAQSSRSKDHFLESIGRGLSSDHPFRKAMAAARKPEYQKPSSPSRWKSFDEVDMSTLRKQWAIEDAVDRDMERIRLRGLDR